MDPRTDIFALGLVMHEMLSGARAFQRDTMPETLAAILKDDAPELPPSVTPAVARIVGRCLEKRPDDRFHAAHDLALALELLSATTQAGMTTPAIRTPDVSRAERRSSTAPRRSACSQRARRAASGSVGREAQSARRPSAG